MTKFHVSIHQNMWLLPTLKYPSFFYLLKELWFIYHKLPQTSSFLCNFLWHILYILIETETKLQQFYVELPLFMCTWFQVNNLSHVTCVNSILLKYVCLPSWKLICISHRLLLLEGLGWDALGDGCSPGLWIKKLENTG